MLTGQVFGRWIVLGPAEKHKHGQKRWLCRCSCADQTERTIIECSLKHGKSRSCGCLQKEMTAEFNRRTKSFPQRSFDNLKRRHNGTFVGPVNYTANKYRRWYYQIMLRARQRGRIPHAERHHVYPYAFSGIPIRQRNPREYGWVHLTFKEHFLCHWLLTKFTEGQAKAKMIHALTMMSVDVNGRRIFSSGQYEICRKVRLTPEYLARRAEIAKAMLTPEYRAGLSANQKKVWEDPEYRARTSAAMRAGHSTPESIAKRSAISKALWEDPEFQVKTLAAFEARGDPVFRAGQSAIQTKKWKDPLYRDNQIAIIKKAREDPEYRAGQSVNQKKVWEDPIYRASQTAAFKKRSENPVFREKIAKLSKWDVLITIPLLRLQGISQQRIADQLGVGQAAISIILLGKGWTHLYQEPSPVFTPEIEQEYVAIRGVMEIA
jgi:hypothetical protein